MNEITDKKKIVECLLFVSSKPVASSKIASIIGNAAEDEIELLVLELAKEYESLDKPVFLQKVAGGWRFATKKEYVPWIKILFAKETNYKLSAASLETLSIISYRQP